MKVLQVDLLKDKFPPPPLRRYATFFWMKHAGACDDLLGEVELPRYIVKCTDKSTRLINHYKGYHLPGPQPNSPLVEAEWNFLVLLASEGCTQLLIRHASCQKCSTDEDTAAKKLLAAEPMLSAEDDEVMEGYSDYSFHSIEISPFWDRALYHATIMGHNKTVRHLQQTNSTKGDPNKLIRSDSALWHACYKGHHDIVKTLLETGGDLLHHVYGSYEYCMHAAVACQHINVIETILSHESDAVKHSLGQQDYNGQNVLHVAATYGKTKALRVLLAKVEKLGMLEELTRSRDLAGRTPLQVAEPDDKEDILNVFAWFGVEE
ncbi:hypothetical protein KVT40_008673 [Elsinoe batatas]|uniref:Uncharacterized protein n=1 Tax=Elsinoe batatas TaxID=2601811 RepID=A0A8K0KUF5_9PEZI|nr:hypothetical protein KVT40_008673 [Elsinoe batatas]